MKQMVCQGCGGTLPMNEMFTVFGRSLCETCGNQELTAARKSPQPGDVIRQTDPTVCSQCNTDEGARELPRVAGMPVCRFCEDGLRRRPFPAWVKLSFVLLLALAVFAFVYNRRFFLGYVEMHRAGGAMARGDLSQASALMTAAAGHVPEQPYLKVMADFFTGIDLVVRDENAEAIRLLQDCSARFPARSPERQAADFYLLAAQAGAAFEAKDYDRFLAKQNEILKARPAEAMAMAGVASAYACKYAVTGDKAHKKQALHYLEMAAGRDTGPQAVDYRQRILHRLQTREIIKKQEFDRRFPNGWNPETEKVIIIPGWLISILTFPGVIVHEAAHMLFCRLRGVAVLDVCFFRVGNPAGYVIHEPIESFNSSFLVCVGPFIVNSLLCIAFCFPAFVPVRVFDHSDPLSIFLIWLGISIGMHAFPSTQDAQVLWHQAQTAARSLHPLALLSFPLVILIYVANAARFFWFDAIYGFAIGLALPELILKQLVH